MSTFNTYAPQAQQGRSSVVLDFITPIIDTSHRISSAAGPELAVLLLSGL